MPKGNGDGVLGIIVLIVGFIFTVCYAVIVLPFKSEKARLNEELAHRNKTETSRAH